MDLSDKGELRWLSVVLANVGEAAPGVDFLIVGAMARDLLLHYGHGVPITRATTDIDLGVAVEGWDEFRELRDACLQSGCFTPGRPGNHRLIHRSGVPLDLIPFGGVERGDGTIEWPEDNSVMGVLGYREAGATATQIQLPGNMPVATVCLPMFAILKLMAWSERHTSMPRKDAKDLFLVLGHYLNDEIQELVQWARLTRKFSLLGQRTDRRNGNRVALSEGRIDGSCRGARTTIPFSAWVLQQDTGAGVVGIPQRRRC